MCAIKGPPGNPPHPSEKAPRMARTYPFTVPYNQCLGDRADPLSFASLRLVNLRNGQSQHLSTLQQLVDALPKTEDPSSLYALKGHISCPGQKRLRHSMRAAIWWLLPSDGLFRRASDSLQYYLTSQGRRVVSQGGDVTLPPWESYLNWVPDPAPPPTRYHGDLTSPGPSEDQENTPPQDASRKLPRRLQPRRHKEKQPGSSTNGNPASRAAGSATQLGSPANRNSALSGSSAATRPRSAANENSPLPGNRPGTSRSSRNTPVEHPRTFLCPQHQQHPRLSTNHNSELQFDPDHPEFRGVYKPSQTSHLYQGYPEEGPYFRPPRRQPDRRLPRCFLCGEEGHFVSHCLAHSVLQRLLRQQAHDNARVPPRGQVLELPPTEDGDQKLPSCTFKLLRGSPEVKVTPVGCAVGPPITGQLTLEGIPVLGLVDTGASVTCMGFSVWWRYHSQWGPLKPFGGVVHGAHGKPLQIAEKCSIWICSGVKQAGAPAT